MEVSKQGRCDGLHVRSRGGHLPIYNKLGIKFQHWTCRLLVVNVEGLCLALKIIPCMIWVLSVLNRTLFPSHKLVGMDIVMEIPLRLHFYLFTTQVYLRFILKQVIHPVVDGESLHDPNYITLKSPYIVRLRISDVIGTI